MTMRTGFAITLVSSLLLWLAGCGGREDVVLYTSIDEPMARAVVDDFRRSSGLRVRLVTDTEANKSVGLAERLRAERSRPRADVWWGNEPFHTIRLANEGVLADWPEMPTGGRQSIFVDRGGRWVGNGVRLRVLAVRSDANVVVRGLMDLTDVPGLRVTLARPITGTTAGHLAALYVLWGDERADAYFRALHAGGAFVVASNSETVRQVLADNADVGWTDNDDVFNANAAADRAVVRILVPDQHDGGIGTLGVPTTVALVAGRKADRSAAVTLAEYLASADVERRLIDSGFAALSVRENSSSEASGRSPQGPSSVVRYMPVGLADVAATMPDATRRVTAILRGEGS